MRIFKWQMFKTKEEAKAFQKQKGYGVFHDLEHEKKRKSYDSITFYEVSEETRNNYPYSIEWTENI